MRRWIIPCKTCGRAGKYNKVYDAYYCEYCNKWLEEKCDSKYECTLCKDRPKEPLSIYQIERLIGRKTE